MTSFMIWRLFLRALVFGGGSFALAAGWGASVAVAQTVAVLMAFLVVLLTSPGSREGLLRIIAGRPYPHRMTEEDWRELRQMEIGLGWTPSNPPVPGSPADALRDRLGRLADTAGMTADTEALDQLMAAKLAAAKLAAEVAAFKTDVAAARARHPHPWLPGECTHPPIVRMLLFTPEGGGPVSAYCGRCGGRMSGAAQPQRTDELVRSMIIASYGVPPASGRQSIRERETDRQWIEKGRWDYQ